MSVMLKVYGADAELSKRSIILPKVVASNNESVESLIRRFRKTVTRSGLLGEIRSRRWHVSRSEQARMDKKKAIRRARRRERESTS